MNYQDRIVNALIEYDSAEPVIKYLKDQVHDGQRAECDKIRPYLVFRDKKTNEEILKTEFELLAMYYTNKKLWSWAWYQPTLYNSENYLAKQILIYSLGMESELSFIKILLTTPRSIIKDSIQVDINLAISSSIIKEPYIYPMQHNQGDQLVIQYLILLNKEELVKLGDRLDSQGK